MPGILTPGKWGRGGDAKSGHLEALGEGDGSEEWVRTLPRRLEGDKD